MIESSQKNIVPLNVWVKAFFLTNLIFWCGYALFAIRDKYIDSHYNTQYIIDTSETAFASNKLKPDMYIIGSSLAINGFYTFGSLDSAIIKNRISLNYKVIYRGGAVISDYNYLIPYLLKTKPQYLFIESNTIGVDISNNLLSISLIQYSIRLSRIPEYLLSLNAHILNLISAPVPKEKQPILSIDENYWALYIKRAKKYRVRAINEFPEWNTFFKQAKKANIQVYILELPRSIEAEKYLPVEFNEQYNSLMTQFQNQYGVIYIPFPYKLNQQKYFEDAAHLNKVGADLYSNWFTTILLDKKLTPSN